ncbi:hypothetical protein WNY59_11895 [Ahrensia kielensis]|uniref:Uncharacterized protein n=1 Tax=Ahrensia kielensis TaxID=76980 RepID=A0ABU9T854_9HYPH
MNLWRNPDEDLAICTYDLVSGSGDIGFFDMRADRFFTHDKRFERGPKAGLTREFSGYLYWHLKYLKPGIGFSNYELNNNPNSRYTSKKTKLDGLTYGASLKEAAHKLRPNLMDKLLAIVDAKQQFINIRNIEVGSFFKSMLLEEEIKKTVLPKFQPYILPQPQA